MKCAACGLANFEGAKLCRRCGAARAPAPAGDPSTQDALPPPSSSEVASAPAPYRAPALRPEPAPPPDLRTVGHRKIAVTLSVVGVAIIFVALGVHVFKGASVGRSWEVSAGAPLGTYDALNAKMLGAKLIGSDVVWEERQLGMTKYESQLGRTTVAVAIDDGKRVIAVSASFGTGDMASRHAFEDYWKEVCGESLKLEDDLTEPTPQNDPRSAEKGYPQTARCAALPYGKWHLYDGVNSVKLSSRKD